MEPTSSRRFCSRVSASALSSASEHGGVAGLLQHGLGDLGGAQVGGAAHQGLEEIAEAEDGVPRGAAERAALGAGAERLEEGGAARVGGLHQPLDGDVADLARGDVDDAEEVHVALGVVDDAQVTEEILDLGPLEEAHAPDDLVGHALGPHHLFEHARLGVDAVEDGDLARRDAAGDGLPDARDDEGRLVVLVVAGDHRHGIAVVVVGPQLLGLAVLRGLDDAERGLDDVVRRSVVLLQLDDGRVGEVAAEAADDAHVGAAPAVDALVVVADHAEVARRGRDGLHQAVLHLVHVLELVDEHVAEAAADSRCRAGSRRPPPGGARRGGCRRSRPRSRP